MEMHILLFTILVAEITSSPVDFTTGKTDATTLAPVDLQQEKEFEKTVRIIRSRSMGRPNTETGREVEEWDPSLENNPEELGNYTQGDILMPPMFSSSRNGIVNLSYRWPNGIIYYRITGTFTDAQRTMISQAMNEYHKATCIKFRPYTGVERDYMSIESSSTGCWSNLGRIGGMQKVNLQSPGCLYYVGTVIHEFMHTVGFYHEQSRMDRDDSVAIQWQNVAAGKEHNFDKYESTAFGVPYDYGSVMHYSKNAFSKNKLDTIVPKRTANIGQRRGFSALDIEKINAMYKCSGTESLL